MGLLSGAAFRMLHAPRRGLGLATCMEAFQNARITILAPQLRNLAAAAAAASKSKSSLKVAAAAPALNYFESKMAAKERRRELYEARQERIARLPYRRAGRPRDQLRRDFRNWFIRRKVNDEYLERKARQAGMGWKHQVAVILERLPVVLPDIEPWEQDYLDLEAHMAQYGKMYPKEFMEQVDDSTTIPTTMEDLMQFLPKGYIPAPRETEADATGDLRTTNRKLKTSIYLAVQEADGFWQLPTVALRDDETLIEATKRAMQTKIGSQVEFWCPSNAPFAVELKKASDAGFFGTKTFFVKIQYDEGSVIASDLAADDFAWLEGQELANRVKQEQGDDAAKFYKYLL
ncbi:hypothetical protein MPSEU_000578200 [Mayamaea pseudoterrestris]|nr:hypothetical protein MPSEU_000578200 [Mayamaea pseudoterrestris]